VSDSSRTPEIGSRPATRRLAPVSGRNIALVGPPMADRSGVTVETLSLAAGERDEQTARTFAQLSDGQVRLRESPGGIEARGQGVDPFSTEWVPARVGR
jgi:hypothetical protein